MEIDHQQGGDMVIVLTRIEEQVLRTGAYVMDRNGLCGPHTKTWVRTDMPAVAPHVQIDGDSDVMAYLPEEFVLPTTISQDDMDPYIDSDRSRLGHHFGVSGAIIITVEE